MHSGRFWWLLGILFAYQATSASHNCRSADSIHTITCALNAWPTQPSAARELSMKNTWAKQILCHSLPFDFPSAPNHTGKKKRVLHTVLCCRCDLSTIREHPVESGKHRHRQYASCNPDKSKEQYTDCWGRVDLPTALCSLAAAPAMTSAGTASV